MKKTNGQLPSSNGNSKATGQFSPLKGCVPIAAKPVSNNLVPLAPMPSSQTAKSTATSSQSKSKTTPKSNTKQAIQPNPMQQQYIQQQQQQQQQQRTIFLNGNLTSILAAVGSNQQQQSNQTNQSINQQQLAQQLAAVALKQQQQQQQQHTSTSSSNNNPSQVQSLNRSATAVNPSMQQMQQFYQFLPINQLNSNMSQLDHQKLSTGPNQSMIITQPLHISSNSLVKGVVPSPIQSMPKNNSNTCLVNNSQNTSLDQQQQQQQQQPQMNASTVFTATTTADGQIILQSLSNPAQPQPQQLDLQQHLMQQNFLNLFQNSTKPNAQSPQQQQSIYFQKQDPQQQFQQNQLNQFMQQQVQQQQQQHQQVFLNTPQLPGLFSQPVAASTPTPPDCQSQLEQNLLRQKLFQEEQKHQHLLQLQMEQSKHHHKPHEADNRSPPKKPNEILLIKPKTELNKTKENLYNSVVETHDTSMHIDEAKEHANTSKSSSVGAAAAADQSNDKRRGRPRLYVKNPLTGKSIKGRLLNGGSILRVVNKPKLLQPKSSLNENGLFPSPSTSVSSSYSAAVNIQKLDSEKTTPTSHFEAESSAESPQSQSSSITSISSSGDEQETDNSKTNGQKPVETPQVDKPDLQKVLTHVIDGYLIKESSKPFLLNADVKADNVAAIKPSTDNTEPLNESGFVCTECRSKKRKETAPSDHKGASLFCSQSCMKRNAKKKQKLMSRKTSGQSAEDMMSRKCVKGKCKSKSHHHRHRHRRHHGASSSSSSSKDKCRDKANESTTQPTEEKQDICPPPPPPPPAVHPLMSFTIGQQPAAFSTNYQSMPQYSNTFNSNAFGLPIGSSAPSSSPTSYSDQQLPPGDPTEWNCDEVFEFVKCVAGIQVAQLFKSQEVDGSALSLIRDDHLVNTMQIKLGPALKIMSKFNELKAKAANACRQY